MSNKTARFIVVKPEGRAWADVVDTTLTNGKGKPLGRVIARANPESASSIAEALNERVA